MSGSDHPWLYLHPVAYFRTACSGRGLGEHHLFDSRGTAIHTPGGSSRLGSHGHASLRQTTASSSLACDITNPTRPALALSVTLNCSDSSRHKLCRGLSTCRDLVGRGAVNESHSIATAGLFQNALWATNCPFLSFDHAHTNQSRQNPSNLACAVERS